MFSYPEFSEFAIVFIINPENWIEEPDTITIYSGDNNPYNVFVEALPIDPGQAEGSRFLCSILFRWEMPIFIGKI
ncbi:MAG: hypothetical protein R2764_24885 [Bacteroidales bacterium]